MRHTPSIEIPSLPPSHHLPAHSYTSASVTHGMPHSQAKSPSDHTLPHDFIPVNTGFCQNSNLQRKLFSRLPDAYLQDSAHLGKRPLQTHTHHNLTALYLVTRHHPTCFSTGTLPSSCSQHTGTMKFSPIPMPDHPCQSRPIK